MLYIRVSVTDSIVDRCLGADQLILKHLLLEFESPLTLSEQPFRLFELSLQVLVIVDQVIDRFLHVTPFFLSLSSAKTGTFPIFK